jgi:hypothetical protein
MSEGLKHELLFDEIVGDDDGWLNLDWTDWRLGMKNRDKTEKDYNTKQVKTAIAWYQRTTGEIIPGYEKDKDLEEYKDETLEKINQAIFAYLTHVDEKSGLKGSENFDRQYSMYREELDDQTIEDKYKKYEERALAFEQEKALALKK